MARSSAWASATSVIAGRLQYRIVSSSRKIANSAGTSASTGGRSRRRSVSMTGIMSGAPASVPVDRQLAGQHWAAGSERERAVGGAPAIPRRHRDPAVVLRQRVEKRTLVRTDRPVDDPPRDGRGLVGRQRRRPVRGDVVLPVAGRVLRLGGELPRHIDGFWE